MIFHSPTGDLMESETFERTVSEGKGFNGFLTALLSEREQYFGEVVNGENLGAKFRYSLLTLLSLTILYGLAAGFYAGVLQAISAAIKLPVLFLVTFFICFPAFYIVQVLVGSRLRLMQVIVLVLSALTLTSILLAAFVPIVIFFLLTGSNYYFLQLLHVVIVVVAGVFGMYALHEALSLVCENYGVYPKKAMTIMRAWAVLFAFVGIQMAWNLRPFLGDRGEPFKIFRHYEGNYYTAIVYSVRQLIERSEKSVETPSDHAEVRFRDLWSDSPDSNSFGETQ